MIRYLFPYLYSSSAQKSVSFQRILEQYVPKKWLPFVAIMRLDKPIATILMIMLSSMGLMLTHAPFKLYIIFAIGSVVMRSAGCIINDITDRNIDKKVERTKNRPLANNSLSLRNAFITLTVCLSIGLAIALYLGPKVWIAAVLVLIAAILYPLSKRWLPFPQLLLGLTFDSSVLIASLASIGTITPSIFLLYLACALWNMGYDTIYALQDKEDDKRLNLQSTAILWQGYIKMAVMLTYTVVVLLIASILMIHNAGILNYVMLGAVISHMLWQITKINENDPKDSLWIFQSNAGVGILIIATLAGI